MRAFSVKVNEVVGVGGFIVPDTLVDVVVTTAISSSRQQDQMSKIVLENIRVLAAGQVVEQQKDNKPVTVNTVTLAVTPDDAEKLALASNDGKIQLVLRNYADSDNVVTGGIDKGRLLASYRKAVAPVAATENEAKPRRVVKKKAAPAAAPRKSYSVEVIKGNKRSEENFQ
jgi:pilus assembly protein CpaB